MITFGYGGYDGAAIIAIDVNGFKGPNKLGKDVYSIGFKNDTPRGFSLSIGSCMVNELAAKVLEGGEI